MQPFVSIITVNYNGKRFLKDNLASLARLDYPKDRYEVLVVDNASVDGSADEAERLYPDVKFIRTGRNTGFALGNNIGLENAKGDLVALINNDAFPHPSWLSALVDALARRPEMAFASSKILYQKRQLEVELRSGSFWPADVLGTTDTRELGIKVLNVGTDGLRDVHVSYGEGFYPEERQSGEVYRWTDGRAHVRLTFVGAPERIPLELSVDGWRPPGVAPARLEVHTLGTMRADVLLPKGPARIALEIPPRDMRTLPRTIQNAGLVAFRDWFAGDRGSGDLDDGRYDREEEIFGACGAAMIARKEVLAECGLFDPSYFMYYEDVDLALRARALGHRCLYVPSAVVEHYHAGSSVEGSRFFQYNVERNRLATMMKHAPLPLAARQVGRYAGDALRLAAREIRRGVFRGGAESAGGVARLKLKVVASLATRTPALLGRRAAIARTRRVPREETERWLVPRTGPGAMVRVGIYDLHLRTLGGGEKYLADLAAVLSGPYSVDLIAYRPPSREVIERRLNVDLSRVRILTLPSDRELDLRSISSRYDIFINGTHDSELEAYSRRSVLVCHFPKRRHVPPLHTVAYDFVAGSGVQYIAGFYEAEQLGKVTQRWTNGCGVLRIRNAVGTEGMVIDIRIIEFRSEGVDVRFALEGRPVPYYEVNVLPYGVTQYKVRIEPGAVEPGRTYFHLAVISTAWRPSDTGANDDRTLGLIVQDVKLARPGGRSPSFTRWRGSYVAGGFLDDVARRSPHLHTYDVILTHSRYSAGWIQGWWGRDARLIYPVIEGLTPLEKRNVILSVGRFFEGHHNKKHILMVLAFKAMCDAGLEGWEFHLVGGTHEEEHHRRYLDRVRREAHGYPIHIHTNIPYEALRGHYGRARIFWHASGHDEDERRHPERFEHFGISTVEAMLAGAVPVVIGKAGQLETVEDGVDGFLWGDVPTLKARTRQLVDDPALLARMSEKAIAKAQHFSRERFRTEVSALVEELVP